MSSKEAINCIRKRAYWNKRFAREVAKRLNKMPGNRGRLHPYLCRMCGKYHLGRRTG